jgi:predicted nucleic acid-binding protein
LAFDLRRSLRRIKPHKFTTPLGRRPWGSLSSVVDAPSSGADLLLDACVYIDVLRGDTPTEVDTLLQLRTVNHLSVCIAELTHAFGRLDPRHPSTATTLRLLNQTIDDIPAHRLATPSENVVIEAGILAGLLFRLGGFAPGREQAALIDTMLYLHAAARGQIVLTRNVSDFDLINQIVPEGRVLFYQTAR